MDNILFLNESNLVINEKIKDSTNRNIFIIDLFDGNVDLKLNIELVSSANVHIIISSLNKSNYSKKYDVFVNHLGNGSLSKCEVYGIAHNQSQSFFNLEAQINKDTFDNSCDQKIRGLLLSGESQIEGKPNLIIDTNNLKAKHALAVGRLNLDYLFYLQSKGISKVDAIKLLLLSYFNVILINVKNEQKKEKFTEKILSEIGTLVF